MKICIHKKHKSMLNQFLKYFRHKDINPGFVPDPKHSKEISICYYK